MKGLALAVALAVAGIAVAGESVPLIPAAVADDKKDKDKQEQERKRQEERRQEAIKKIAADFGAGSTAVLLGRVPKGRKLSLSLPTKSGDFAVDQAEAVLASYFADVVLTVQTEKDATFVDNVGSFPVTARKKGEAKGRSGHLTVTVGPATERFPLVKLAVDV